MLWPGYRTWKERFLEDKNNCNFHMQPGVSLVPRPCAFVACSTKFAQRRLRYLREFRTASDEQGLGTRLSPELWRRKLGEAWKGRGICGARVLISSSRRSGRPCRSARLWAISARRLCRQLKTPTEVRLACFRGTAKGRISSHHPCAC